MFNRIGLIGVIASLLAAACAQSPRVTPVATDPPPARPALTSSADLVVTIPIAEFSGDPAQIGAQHGHRFRDDVHNLYANYLLTQLKGRTLVQARIAAAMFELYMLPEHRAEIQALADAAGLSVYDAMLGQCFLDLLPVTGCSTITLPASASPDGVARFGRNLDFDSLGILQNHTVLLIYHPQGKYAFAAIGWPGMVGVVSGMNQWGLSLANMEVDRPFRPPSAMPYTLLYRAILEQCRSVDDAIAFLQRTPRQSANNLMLMDAAGCRAVAEIRPEGVTVRWGLDGTPLISTNHQRGQDQATPGYCWRYDALHQQAVANFGKIGLRGLQKMLATVVQGSNGDDTLQSMIFEPSNRVLYLAAGSNAPSHPFEQIDLARYFAAATN